MGDSDPYMLGLFKAAKAGWVLIKVKAFGLNRAELFTRQGDSPGVTFQRVLGIEAVGIVELAPDTTFEPGQKVAAIMGGMGRQFDGSYAEYTLVPESSVFPLETELDWAKLGEASIGFGAEGKGRIYPRQRCSPSARSGLPELVRILRAVHHAPEQLQVIPEGRCPLGVPEKRRRMTSFTVSLR